MTKAVDLFLQNASDAEMAGFKSLWTATAILFTIWGVNLPFSLGVFCVATLAATYTMSMIYTNF